MVAVQERRRVKDRDEKKEDGILLEVTPGGSAVFPEWNADKLSKKNQVRLALRPFDEERNEEDI